MSNAFEFSLFFSATIFAVTEYDISREEFYDNIPLPDGFLENVLRRGRTKHVAVITNLIVNNFENKQLSVEIL